VSAYYNECDPLKAEIIREAIKANAIADGDVDARSITEVRASDLVGYTQCHWFAGGGFWSLALRQAGWPDEREVWTGSAPCPSFSVAGKGQGFADPRHLWPDWMRLIRECRPAVIFGEQVRAAIGYGWLDLVQSDLEAQDYAVGKIVFERAASARRTSDKDFTGWRSPNARLNGGGDYSDPKKAAKRIEQGHQLKLSEEVLLSSWSTPMAGTPAQNGYNEAGNNDSSRKTVALAAWPTPCTPNGDRSVSTEVMDATGKMLDGRKHTASLEHAVKFAGPVRLTASGEMLTGSDAGMGDFGQLDGAHSLWLQGIPAEWRNFVWRAMQSAFLQRKRSLKPTSKRNGNK